MIFSKKSFLPIEISRGQGLVSGIEKMRTELYAYVAPTQELLFKLAEREESCDYVIVGANLFYGNMVMAWPKNFSYGPLFNY